MVLALLCGTAHAQGYEATPVKRAYAYGVNDAGVMVGFDPYADPPSAFAIGTRHSVKLLGLAGTGVVGFAGSIHEDVIVGQCMSGNNPVPCSWNGTRTATALALPDGYTAGQANRISADGRIAGSANVTLASALVPVVWTDGVPSILPVPPGTFQGSAAGTNRLGQVVGNIDQGSGWHAVVWQGDAVTSLPGGEVPGTGTIAGATNASGTIVGAAVDTATGTTHAVAWQDGSMIRLPELAPGSSYAVDINEAGDIVGYSGGHGVLWHDGEVIDLDAFLPDALKRQGYVLDQANGISNTGFISAEAFRPGESLPVAIRLTPSTAERAGRR